MSFGIKELIVVLLIVMLVFGTKKIRGVGSDVGGWIRDFRKALKDGENDAKDDEAEETTAGRVIDNETARTKENV